MSDDLLNIRLNQRNNDEILKQNIIRQIKVFDGDMFGYYGNEHSGKNYWLLNPISDISCRLNPCLVEIFLRTIDEKFIILPKSFKNLSYERNYTLISKYCHNAKKIDISIIVISRYKFSKIIPDFDVEGVTQNNHSKWVRPSIPGLILCEDKLFWLENRIKSRKFCLLEQCNSKTSSTISELIEKCIIMINSGWTMDDIILPNKSWVICRWIDLVKITSYIRTMANNRDDWIKSDICNICQSKLLSNDIVINLSCGHNFHWKCESGGLHQWVKGQSKKTCPNCRKII